MKTTITYEELLYLKSKGENVKVQTPKDYSNVSSTFTKISSGYLLKLSDTTSIKCAITHNLLIDEKWVSAQDIKIGDYLTDKFGNKNKQVIDKISVPEQEWIDFEVENEFQAYIQNGVVHHNSGKSLAIYCIVSFFLAKKLKGLILVPSVSLTTQLFGDFKEYGASDEFLDRIQLIGGSNNDKNVTKELVISTWQSAMSIETLPPSLDFVVVDEAHGLKFENKSTDIVYNASKAKYRIGLTGTLPEDQIAKMSIMACVGAPKRYIRTQDLILRGLATPVHVNILHLKYSPNDKALFKYVGNYAKQLQFVKEHENRNAFISKLSLSVSNAGNTVVMCSHVQHMKDIFTEVMKQKYPDVEIENKNITGKKAFEFQDEYKVYFIAGSTNDKDREKIISILKGHSNAILITNYQLFSTGINAKGIKNIIFASPLKSYTTITQSIGRAIRLHVSKNVAEIYDCVDDFSPRGNNGTFYKQYINRINLSYIPEGFPITERNLHI